MGLELTYCDLIESDDYYVSDTFIFQSQIFPTYNPRQYAYEHSVSPRAKESFKRTPNGRQWANVWDQIESNQNRAEGKRRNRYHISWQSKRVTQPGRTENIPTTVEKVNPLDPDGEKLRFTTYEKRETPPVFAPVEMLYFDIDDLDEVEAFKTLPSTIWTRSPSGRHHVFILIYPCDYQRARERVAEWMYRNELRTENNIIPRSGTTLNSILIPGQDAWTLPCQPGQPDESIASDYQETIALFADHYQNKRLDVDAAFPFSREISKPVQSADTEPVTTTAATPSPIYKVKAKAKRNRPRLGSLCNIPGITGALRITRDEGTIDEQTFEYRTIDDCLDEANGFHIASPYFAALLRKHCGDGDAAESDYLSNRQTLRTLTSKKHRPSFLRQDARAMKRYFVRMYNSKMMKHSERNQQDAEAMQSVNLIAPHSYAVVIQSLLQTNKTAIVEQYGKRAYQTVQSIVHHVTSDIQTNNGRIAQRSKKSRKEYTFADSRTMIDYPGIDGDKHLLGSVVQILRQYVLSISDPHDWSEAKCTRWTYQEQIIDKAKEEAIPKGTKETKKGFLSLTNVGPSMPGWLDPYPEDADLTKAIDDILSDLGQKLMETIEPTTGR